MNLDSLNKQLALEIAISKEQNWCSVNLVDLCAIVINRAIPQIIKDGKDQRALFDVAMDCCTNWYGVYDPQGRRTPYACIMHLAKGSINHHLIRMKFNPQPNFKVHNDKDSY